MTQEQAMIEYYERKFDLIMRKLERLELLCRNIDPDIYAYQQMQNKGKQEQGFSALRKAQEK